VEQQKLNSAKKFESVSDKKIHDVDEIFNFDLSEEKQSKAKPGAKKSA